MNSGPNYMVICISACFFDSCEGGGKGDQFVRLACF
jgi:hypothetical protein